MFKIIGVGNKLLCDDGVAIYVIDELKDRIHKLHDKIEIITGETDYMYCLENINNDDIVVIIDSSFLGFIPGTVTLSKQVKTKIVYSSQHQVSLQDLINKYNEKIKVYTIGIEIYKIDYAYCLSEVLNKKFDKICKEVLKKINFIIKENKNA